MTIRKRYADSVDPWSIPAPCWYHPDSNPSTSTTKERFLYMDRVRSIKCVSMPIRSIALSIPFCGILWNAFCQSSNTRATCRSALSPRLIVCLIMQIACAVRFCCLKPDCVRCRCLSIPCDILRCSTAANILYILFIREIGL